MANINDILIAPENGWRRVLFTEFDNINFNGYIFNNDLDTFLLNIDTMFPGSNFLENFIKKPLYQLDDFKTDEYQDKIENYFKDFYLLGC